MIASMVLHKLHSTVARIMSKKVTGIDCTGNKAGISFLVNLNISLAVLAALLRRTPRQPLI